MIPAEMLRPTLVPNCGICRLKHIEGRKSISITASLKNTASAPCRLVDADALALFSLRRTQIFEFVLPARAALRGVVLIE